MSRNWHRIGTTLVVTTMAYNVLEAGVALVAGIAAASIALVGFGLDSVIELAAATVLLWRVSVEARGADEEEIEATEEKALRFIGGTFALLALYVLVEATVDLLRGSHAEESVVGIVLAAASAVIMPLVAWGKLRAAAHTGNRALAAEAKETLACSYLSFTLLLGLLANAVVGWWWADPTAALLMVPWLIREAVEGLRAERC